ncbi:DNA polymerase III subunit gamma/tau [Agromyces sp. Root81]|uniref:DNA polymerase III subunit gamma/tau n=1 Tax=Agromyces sp. Root81 TaxID=1736601 RepID=UPI000A57E527|nr:DNA polymerase III subunit gamma/tau [Agromyces sp. Root81]
MTRDSDDDALRWEGDDDPTLAPGWKTVGAPAAVPAAEGDSPDEHRAAIADDESASEAENAEVADAASQTSSAELVVLGVLGGIYLLYAIGWLVVALGEAPVFADPVAQFMYGLGSWFAVLAAPLWFGAVLWLAADHRRARLIWLIAGAVLLVPVPFLLRG